MNDMVITAKVADVKVVGAEAVYQLDLGGASIKARHNGNVAVRQAGTMKAGDMVKVTGTIQDGLIVASKLSYSTDLAVSPGTMRNLLIVQDEAGYSLYRGDRSVDGLARYVKERRRNGEWFRILVTLYNEKDGFLCRDIFGKDHVSVPKSEVLE